MAGALLDTSWLIRLGDWPLAAWVAVGVAALAGVRWIMLVYRRRPWVPRGLQAEELLIRAATRLRQIAQSQAGRLPAGLDQPLGEEFKGVRYRPVPSLTLDSRLILVHDREATHKLLAFPRLLEGRGVVFCSGKLCIVTESQFEQLLAADDRLRARLGLPPVADDEGCRAGLHGGD